MDKVTVELLNYEHYCGDGCCLDYGTIVKVNGEELPFRNTEISVILEGVLKHLGFTDVEVIESYEQEE